MGKVVRLREVKYLGQGHTTRVDGAESPACLSGLEANNLVKIWWAQLGGTGPMGWLANMVKVLGSTSRVCRMQS